MGLGEGLKPREVFSKLSKVGERIYIYIYIYIKL
jgi:hypothetical protein